MSLLYGQMVKCQKFNVSAVADGYGGATEARTEGETFFAAFQLKSSLKGAVALSPQADDVYVVTTPRAVVLNFGDTFKRIGDSREFRVVSDGRDRQTPPSTALDMRNVECEVIKL